MTREAARENIPVWRMLCDIPGCGTKSEPFLSPPDLEIFRKRGWHIAEQWGDICPECRYTGHKPKDEVEVPRGILKRVMEPGPGPSPEFRAAVHRARTRRSST